MASSIVHLAGDSIHRSLLAMLRCTTVAWATTATIIRDMFALQLAAYIPDAPLHLVLRPDPVSRRVVEASTAADSTVAEEANNLAVLTIGARLRRARLSFFGLLTETHRSGSFRSSAS